MDKESLERFNRIETMIEKSEQRIEKSEQRIEKSEQRIEKSEQRIEKSERRLEKFQKAFEEDTKIFNERMDRLAESQEKNDISITKFNGFVSNAGRETEELFIKSIEKNDLKIGDYQFDFLNANVSRRSKSIGEVEVDLLLLNTDILGLLEVKSTLHKNDVQEHFEKRLPKFRELFSEYRDKQIIGMVGGKVVNADAVKLAHDCGFVVLTPKEQGLKVDDEYVRVLKMDTNTT